MIPLRTQMRHLWQLFDTEIITTALFLLFIVMLFGVVGSMDYADEQRMAAERHQKARNHVEQAFLDCLNGKPVAQTKTAVIVCSKAYEVLKP